MDVGDRNGQQHFLLLTSVSNIDLTLINDWSPIHCRAPSSHHKFRFLQYFKLSSTSVSKCITAIMEFRIENSNSWKNMFQIRKYDLQMDKKLVYEFD